MSSSGCFDFLKAAWGIELLDKAKLELEEQAESLSQKHIQEYLLDSDIRKIGVVSALPKNLAQLSTGAIPNGRYLVQVSKIADVTQPAKFQEDFEGGKWRLLALDLADGEQKFRAIEYGPIKDLGVHLPPGTKLLLSSSSEAPLRVCNSHMMLEPACVRLLGGTVEKLTEAWHASREVEEKRLLWRTEGIKKKGDGEGAPPWVDFDPKKSRGGGRKALEDEFAVWRATPSNTASTSAAPKEQHGARFQVQDFAAEGDTSNVVKSQVASTAFAQGANGGKGKGKDKDRGKGEDRGKGGRKGRDWEGEEKRAPQAVNTLAAFIKPTKKGELPDEAVAALIEPEPESRQGAAWEASGGWDSWDAGGWGQQSWGGGGWNGGGGGGKGHGKGKGGKKGGGKKGGRY